MSGNSSISEIKLEKPFNFCIHKAIEFRRFEFGKTDLKYLKSFTVLTLNHNMTSSFMFQCWNYFPIKLHYLWQLVASHTALPLRSTSYVHSTHSPRHIAAVYLLRVDVIITTRKRVWDLGRWNILTRHRVNWGLVLSWDGPSIRVFVI